MLNFLHSFQPQPILFSWKFINLHWYGLFIALGSLASLVVLLFLARRHKLDQEKVVDLYFYMIIIGLLGARLYSILLDLPYYLNNLGAIWKFWQGGLAIHGGIIFGALTLMYLVRKNHWDFWIIASLAATVVPLGQAIGRWGNYFNQELFGKPTNLPFGIPININNRPAQYWFDNFFHPVFLYESLGDLLIFTILFSWQIYLIKKDKISSRQGFLISWSYLGLYSLLRFWTESLRVDEMPTLAGWRWSQLVSLIILILAILMISWSFLRKQVKVREN